MPKHAYGDDAEQLYPQYLDVEKGTTLVAEPGKSYEIAVAEGWDLPVPPEDGRWPTPRPAKAKSEES